VERLYHQWQPKRLNGIINNGLYIGKILRQRFIKGPVTGLRAAILKPTYTHS
jgi:hypothetical protein